MLNQYFSNITPMQKPKKSYPSQSPLTNTQPTKTHKPDKHTTQQNQQAHNTTKPTSTPHKSNNSQQQKDWLSTNIAEPGFDPGTFGLWAQHTNHCATPLLHAIVKNSL